MKKFSSIMLILMLVFLQATAVFAEESDNVANLNYQIAEKDGLIAYNEILRAFSSVNNEDVATLNLCQDETPSSGFPDAFGGAYTNPDNGKLIVCINKDSDEIEVFKQQINIIISESDISSEDNVEYEMVDYSYNDIMKVANEILPEYSEKYDTVGVIKGYYTRFTDNEVVVILSEINDESTSSIRNFVNERLNRKSGSIDILRFESGNGLIENQATHKGGDEIALEINHPTEGNQYATYSVGFRAKKVVNGVTKYGFVTAGHGVEYAVDDIWYDGSGILGVEIGETYSIADTASADAAFVVFNSNHTASTAINGYSKSYNTSGYYSVSENLTIKKSGATTGLTTGTVTSTSFTSTSAGVSDVILSTYDSDGGDSGGIVFYDNGSNVFVVGIHKGRYTVTDKAVTCKAGNILSELGLSMWS